MTRFVLFVVFCNKLYLLLSEHQEKNCSLAEFYFVTKHGSG